MPPITLLTAITLILAGSITSSFADPQTDDAVKAAEAWLHLVDDAQYKESWETASGFFKERISEKDWTKMAALARKPFGTMEERKLLKATYTTTLPGAPDGEYVVIQFQTAFTHKKEAVENVTPMKDPDGQWRVSGYFIK